MYKIDISTNISNQNKDKHSKPDLKGVYGVSRYTDLFYRFDSFSSHRSKILNFGSSKERVSLQKCTALLVFLGITTGLCKLLVF